MVGAVFGAFFIGVLGLPPWIGAPAAIAVGCITGYLTERVAVRPVLKKIDEHLYVLTTLALATMLQQGVAAWWGTEPRPFPALLGNGVGWADPKLWLPFASVLVVLAGLEVFYGRTLLGRSFIAVAEDAVAARTLGIPDDRIRVASYCLAGAVGALAGVAGGQLLHAFFALGGSLGFYGFVPIAIGGLGSTRGAVLGGAGPWCPAAGRKLRGGRAVQRNSDLHGLHFLFAAAAARRVRAPPRLGGSSGMDAALPAQPRIHRAIGAATPGRCRRRGSRCGGDPAARRGQPVLDANRHAGLHLLGSDLGPQSPGRLCGAIGDRLRQPHDDRRLHGSDTVRTGRLAGICRDWSLRCRRRTIRPGDRPAGTAPEELLLRHGHARVRDHRHADRPRLGRPDRRRGRPARSGLAAAVQHASRALLPGARCGGFGPPISWPTSRAAHVGRGLVAIRDAEVRCGGGRRSDRKPQAEGLQLRRAALAGVSGALFAARQSYITPDAFTFDLSILFFIAVLIGGRGRIVGPMIGTAILTLLPEIAAPLVSWATFAYGTLLLAVSLLLPGGIASFIEKHLIRRPPAGPIAPPRTEALGTALGDRGAAAALVLSDGSLSFGGVHALKGLDLVIRPGEVHALIGPNGSGKTTALNVLSGFYRLGAGRLALDGRDVTSSASSSRATMGIARTFQKPRIVGNLGVLENAMLGGYARAEAGFLAVAAGLPRARRADATLRARALAALEVVGLRAVASHRAEELQHTGQRLLEIARCLVMSPSLVLLDEPAAGLSHDELEHLRQIVQGMRAHGIGVMLVEHHADLVFSLSDHVTVLNLGSVLASGTPTEIRASADVIEAYLGS